jgi:polyhydroxyalkanoate synthesis regulator phasin
MKRRTTMATKRTKKTTRAKKAMHARRSTSRVRPVARQAADRLRETWSDTVARVSAAEKKVEKQVRRLLERNQIGTTDAATLLHDVNARVAKERKRAARQLEARLAAVQARARKERQVVARMASEAAQGALAAFNIPSRKEVHELTRKVDQLSRKIDSLRR